MSLVFRPIRDDELDAAYGILVDAVKWLAARSIRQWSTPVPRPVYARYQKAGENYGLFDGPTLLAVVTLRQAVADEWKEEAGQEAVWWLSKLAVADAHRQRGYGRQLTEAAVHHLRDADVTELW